MGARGKLPEFPVSLDISMSEAQRFRLKSFGDEHPAHWGEYSRGQRLPPSPVGGVGQRLMVPMNEDQADGLNDNTGPCRFLLSRTMTTWAGVATSMQLPLEPDLVLLRQVTRVRSIPCPPR